LCLPAVFPWGVTAERLVISQGAVPEAALLPFATENDMPTHDPTSDQDRRRQLVAEARRSREARESSYREQALKLFPWICARCGREFGGRKLRELTVHHKDHDHHNNPPDGSNWELLCIYCHENEHTRERAAEAYDEAAPGEDRSPEAGYRPFANLDALLKRGTPSDPDETR
jgi:hypothetical protein